MTHFAHSSTPLYANQIPPGAKTLLEKFDHPIDDAVCSLDGKYMAVCDSRPRVTVWALAEDGERYTSRFLTRYRVTRLCFSPDSSLLACVDPRFIFVWKLSPVKDELIFSARHDTTDAELFFHPSGKELIVHTPENGTSVWDIATSNCIANENLSQVCQPEQVLIPLGYSADGNSFMCSTYWSETFVSWHFRGGNRVNFKPTIIKKELSASVLSPDRTAWTYSDGDGKVISTRRVDDSGIGPCQWSTVCDGRVKLIDVSSDNKYVAAALTTKGTICVWCCDNPNGKPIATMTGSRNEAVKIQFCPGSAKLLVATDGNEVFTWDFGEFPELRQNADYVSKPITLLEHKYAKLETEYMDMARNFDRQEEQLLAQKDELEAKLKEMTAKVQEQEKQLKQQRGRINRKPPQAPSDDLADVLDTAATRRSTRTRKPSNRLRH